MRADLCLLGHGFVGWHGRSLLEDDFATDFFRATPAPQGCSEHATILLRITLLRPEMSRGRDGPELNAKQSLQRRGLALELCAFFNGDWRLPRCQHFCPGRHCCDSKQVAVDIGEAGHKLNLSPLRNLLTRLLHLLKDCKCCKECLAGIGILSARPLRLGITSTSRFRRGRQAIAFDFAVVHVP